MKRESYSSPVTVFASDSTKRLTVIAIGTSLQNILFTENLLFLDLLDSRFQCSTLGQLALACKRRLYIVVIADLSDAIDFEIAESIARWNIRRSKRAVTFLVNIGNPPKNAQSAFTNRISMCNSFTLDLLNSLVDGLIRLQFDPGWVGVDVYDLVTALESPDKNVLAAVGFASGTVCGKAAAQAALDELKKGGVSIPEATGLAAMMVFDGVGLSQANAAMNLICTTRHPDTPIAICCHEVSGHLPSARVTLVASPGVRHYI